MFGKKLKELRDLSGLSMDMMVEKYNSKYDAKMNKSTLSRYENGLQVPIYTVVVNLADFFGVSIDYLLGRSDIPNERQPENKPPLSEKQKAVLHLAEQLSDEDMNKLIDYAALLKKADS